MATWHRKVTKKMNQSEFAKHIGTTRQTVSKMKKEGILAMNGKLVDVDKSMDYLKRVGRVSKEDGKIVNKGISPTPRHHTSKTRGNLAEHYSYDDERRIEYVSKRIALEFESIFKSFPNDREFIPLMGSLDFIEEFYKEDPYKFSLLHMGRNDHLDNFFILSPSGNKTRSFTFLVNKMISEQILKPIYDEEDSDYDSHLFYNEVKNIERLYEDENLESYSASIKETEESFQVLFDIKKKKI